MRSSCLLTPSPPLQFLLRAPVLASFGLGLASTTPVVVGKTFIADISADGKVDPRDVNFLLQALAGKLRFVALTGEPVVDYALRFKSELGWTDTWVRASHICRPKPLISRNWWVRLVW